MYGAATTRTQRAASLDHQQANGLVVDAEPLANLHQRQTIDVETHRLLTHRLRHGRPPDGESGLADELRHGTAVYLEASRQLVNGHSIGVPSEQLGVIRGTQTGLRLARTSAHRTPLIDHLGALRAASPTVRPLDDAGDQRAERPRGV